MKKRVLYFIMAPFFGGVTKVIKNICLKLKDENDIEIILIVSKESKEYFKEIKNITLIELDYKNKIKFLLKVFLILKKYKIDIIHSHDNTTSILSYLLKFFYFRKLKIISHVHACNEWLKERGLKKILDKFFRNKYDFTIFCGEEVKKYYIENAKYTNFKKTVVLSNSIEIKKEDRVYKKNINHKLRVGYIGRISKEKGLMDFVRALKEKKDNLKNIEFIIIGTGEEENLIKQYLKDSDMDKYFNFIGFTSEVESYYNKIDILIVPSHTEALPMVILEAMANKILVLSMDVGSIKEVINKDTGMLVEKENYKLFVEKLLELIDLKAENYNFLVENAYELVDNKYNMNKYIDNLKNIYIEL